jgi:hypothetical protein
MRLQVGELNGYAQLPIERPLSNGRATERHKGHMISITGNNQAAGRSRSGVSYLPA